MSPLFTQRDLDTAQQLLALDRAALLARYDDAQPGMPATGMVMMAQIVLGLFGGGSAQQASKRFNQQMQPVVDRDPDAQTLLSAQEPDAGARLLCQIARLAGDRIAEPRDKLMVLSALMLKSRATPG
ncbi:MAG: hypothetical protein MRY63_10705 [Neomegalonema sp.]|nr:hypothetical protein [Neomegalonema sp.]